MATTIRIGLYTNGDDAFVAWKPSAFIEDCRGFMLERQRKTAGVAQPVENVENRVGFKKDKPKSGDHRTSDIWPFQRFNWTDHVVDIGNNVRYRVTAMMFAGKNKPFEKGVSSAWTAWTTLATDCGDGVSCFFNRGLVLSQFVARYMRDKHLSAAKFKANLKASVDPAFRAWNIEREMERVRCPVLAIQGEDDEYGTMAQIARLAHHVPQARLVKLAQCGHSPHRDQPERVVDAAASFVRTSQVIS